MQAVGWTAWAGLATASNPATPIFGRSFDGATSNLQEDFERVRSKLFLAFVDNIQTAYPDLEKVLNF